MKKIILQQILSIYRKTLGRLRLFYQISLCLLFVLAIVRQVFPGVMTHHEVLQDGEIVAVLDASASDGMPVELQEGEDQLAEGLMASHEKEEVEEIEMEAGVQAGADVESLLSDEMGNVDKIAQAVGLSLLPLPQVTSFQDSLKHRIFSVPGRYTDNFPDIQDVQYPAAVKWGINPLRNRVALADNQDKLVYIGANPYIHLDEAMHSSVPYLVPRASDLLEHLGKAFMDSLYAKRIPLHKFVVSSVLRTEADVARLQVNNVNATQRSCHMFGTTFDINYNRYYTVSNPDGPRRRTVRDDSLKMVLSEVLRDARREGRCYVRYEQKQPCFHITVR